MRGLSGAGSHERRSGYDTILHYTTDQKALVLELFAQINRAQQRDSVFRRSPISARLEMCAYEALWLNEGAWFANIANLFRSNPGAVPSELVSAEEADAVCRQLQDALGEKLGQVGVRVNGAGEYPARLRDADHPVELLYYRGNWELVETPSVAIVGTREPSDDGVQNAQRITRALVREGYTVVSGLAKGIDTAVHREALKCQGRTVAVIGTPLFNAYPRENADLQDEIAAKHLLVSQVPFLRYARQHYKANSLFFPARNVTMSALTKATVIIEAGNTSGTLVQARAALAQKRKLFILESCFRKTDLTWPAKYERQGAIRVQNVSQILKELSDDTSSEN